MKILLRSSHKLTKKNLGERNNLEISTVGSCLRFIQVASRDQARSACEAVRGRCAAGRPLSPDVRERLSCVPLREGSAASACPRLAPSHSAGRRRRVRVHTKWPEVTRGRRRLGRSTETMSRVLYYQTRGCERDRHKS